MQHYYDNQQPFVAYFGSFEMSKHTIYSKNKVNAEPALFWKQY